MSDSVEEIKGRLDIVEVIRGYVRLEKAGINFKGLCPFHSEKTPSFSVSPAKQMWYCFGCNKGGDVFAFVQAIDNIEFPEVLKILADKAGVTLKRERPELRSQRLRLYDLLEAATSYFERQLKQNEKAGEYLRSRGLNEETIAKFRIGFAPQTWQNLVSHLHQAGFKDSEILSGGVAIQSTNPKAGFKIYDRFRGRIMFPVFDHSGRPTGFSGRILQEGNSEAASAPSSVQREEPKYVNTSNTPVYDKGKILYGFSESKQAIREADCAVLVEGNMDFLMSWQAGIKNTVACSGTALTGQHLILLRRLCSKLTTAFDMDNAGQAATKRSIDLALSQGFDVKVIQLPQGIKDPADLVVSSAAAWASCVKQARPVMEYYFETVLSRNDASSVEGKKKIAAMLLPEIKKLTSKIEQAHWLDILSQKLQIKESVLEQEMMRLNILGESKIQSREAVVKEVSGVSKLEVLLERILYLFASGVADFSVLSAFKDLKLPQSRAGLVFVKLGLVADFGAGEWRSKLEKADAEFIDYLTFKYETLGMPANPDKELHSCLNAAAQIILKEELTNLTWQIKEAEKRKQEEQVQELTRKLHEKAKRLAELFK